MCAVEVGVGLLFTGIFCVLARMYSLFSCWRLWVACGCHHQCRPCLVGCGSVLPLHSCTEWAKDRGISLDLNKVSVGLLGETYMFDSFLQSADSLTVKISMLPMPLISSRMYYLNMQLVSD